MCQQQQAKTVRPAGDRQAYWLDTGPERRPVRGEAGC